MSQFLAATYHTHLHHDHHFFYFVLFFLSKNIIHDNFISNFSKTTPHEDQQKNKKCLKNTVFFYLSSGSRCEMFCKFGKLLASKPFGIKRGRLIGTVR